MYYLRTESSFDSAHFLSHYEGKCRNIHGHRWRVIVEIKGDLLVEQGPKQGMLVDFGELNTSLKELCDYLDHSFIFEKNSLLSKTVAALKEENFRLIEVDFIPTAEKFANYFYNKMKEVGYSVSKVEVYETPNNFASYEE